ncbi:MAG TPA: multicopper oxidase domain-containing protein [Gaiellaceae bacterium]
MLRPKTTLSRRRFLAGAVPAVVSLPFLKDAFCSADPKAKAEAASHASAKEMDMGAHAGAMEMGGHATATEHAASSGPSKGSGATATHELLYPPGADPARRGRVREIEIVAENREVEIADGVTFPAWTYNGSVPGPVIRATEGDHLRIHFRNEGSHPHTMHFHGIHRPAMDGALEQVEPGKSFTYEFAAKPAGLHLYHCHVIPFAEHLNRGLYGAFIVDPPEPRPEAQELVMVLSGYDVNGDSRNEIYAVNGRAFAYEKTPIVVRRDKPVRIYVVNATEFDQVSSFHLHAEMFRLYRTGTAREPEYTDTVMLCQGERAVLEVEFQDKGLYMFHPHQSRAMERGAMGWFSVVDTDAEAAGAVVALNGYAENFANCDPCIDEIGAKALLKY